MSIDCPVSGFPLPDIIWSKNGKRLNPEYDLVYLRNNGTLVMPHVTSQMQGTYECFAVNAGGGHARNVTLSVIGRHLGRLPKIEFRIILRISTFVFYRHTINYACNI